jgi:hypothetical protein
MTLNEHILVGHLLRKEQDRLQEAYLNLCEKLSPGDEDVQEIIKSVYALEWLRDHLGTQCIRRYGNTSTVGTYHAEKYELGDNRTSTHVNQHVTQERMDKVLSIIPDDLYDFDDEKED